MKRHYKLLLVAFGVAFAGIQAQIPAQAQDKYPNKAVKLLVPYGPGGATDIVARIVGEHLREILGQAFYVENKPGGYGMIAIEDMARSKPDGYTLMVGNVSTNAITPVLFKSKLKINYDRDVMPVMKGDACASTIPGTLLQAIACSRWRAPTDMRSLELGVTGTSPSGLMSDSRFKCGRFRAWLTPFIEFLTLDSPGRAESETLDNEGMVVLLLTLLVGPVVGPNAGFDHQLIPFEGILGQSLTQSPEGHEPQARDDFARGALLVPARVVVSDQADSGIERVSFCNEFRVTSQVADSNDTKTIHDISPLKA